MSRHKSVKLLRLALCALVAASVVVVAPRDGSFGVMVVVILAVAFCAGLAGGSWVAMPLTPIAMFVGGLLESWLRDYPATQDEVPEVFAVLFYVFGFVVLAVWAGIGVLAERLVRKRPSRKGS